MDLPSLDIDTESALGITLHDKILIISPVKSGGYFERASYLEGAEGGWSVAPVESFTVTELHVASVSTFAGSRSGLTGAATSGAAAASFMGEFCGERFSCRTLGGFS